MQDFVLYGVCDSVMKKYPPSQAAPAACDQRLSGDVGRVLVYSNAALLQDQKLVYGDNQFLLEIESLDSQFYLYFIHAGGYWFFRGLSGYVV